MGESLGPDRDLDRRVDYRQGYTPDFAEMDEQMLPDEYWQRVYASAPKIDPLADQGKWTLGFDGSRYAGFAIAGTTPQGYVVYVRGWSSPCDCDPAMIDHHWACPLTPIFAELVEGFTFNPLHSIPDALVTLSRPTTYSCAKCPGKAYGYINGYAHIAVHDPVPDPCPDEWDTDDD